MPVSGDHTGPTSQMDPQSIAPADSNPSVATSKTSASSNIPSSAQEPQLEPVAAKLEDSGMPSMRQPPSFDDTKKLKTDTEEEEYDDDDHEDDLDELDDLLDEFNPALPSDLGGRNRGESSSQGASLTQPSLDSLDDDFARQLQQGMADLLKEMEESPEFQAQFDSLVKELDKTTEPGATDTHPAENIPIPPASNLSSDPSTTAEEDAAQGVTSFRDTIARTMERMKESGAEIDTEMADSQSDDFLAEMLRQMQTATGQGGSDEDFSKMLMGMMEQLTNKEILYEPMKELDEKFPNWLVENEGRFSAEEMENFRKQSELVREIVGKFEQPSYSDASEVDREYIVERMQKMQAVGSPPAELLGDAGQGDGLPPDIENCPVQ